MHDTDWTFGGLWPYQPRWFDTPDGKLHYIDEGPRDGPTAIFVHGNPEWSFLFRHDIAALLAAGVRVIAIDHLGFGRSDKPDDASLYTIRRHSERLALVLDTLHIAHATMICHDWGGPIGLPWAIANHAEVERLCVMNTIGHQPTQPAPMPLPLRILRGRGSGDLLVKGLNMFTKVFMFKLGVTHPEHLTPTVRQAYLAPHPNWKSRTGVLAFPRQIPTSMNSPMIVLMGEVESGLRKYFANKPVWAIWGMKDISFGPVVLAEWQKMFPNAKVITFDNAGHFANEDEPEKIAEAVVACVTGRAT